MIKGYVLGEGRESLRVNSAEAVAEAYASPETVLWVDVEQPAEGELAALRDIFGFAQEAIEDCVSGEQRPRVDEFADHVFFIVYGVFGAEDGEGELSPRKLGIFCAQRYVVTVHAQSMRTISTLRRRAASQKAQLLRRGVDHLLYVIIDAVVDNYVLLVEAFQDRLERLEEKSLDPDVDRSLLADLSDLRRDLVNMRRLAASHRDMLQEIVDGEYELISEALEQKFDHVLDHLLKAQELLDGLREIMYGVRDNYHSTLSNRLNEVMKTLTIFASILLPLSLISGLLGMNIEIWPTAETPYAFEAVVALMVIIALGMLYFFRRRKWL